MLNPLTPATHVDGFPVAITIDLSVRDDLDDMGTGARGAYEWTQNDLNMAAERAVLNLTPDRVTRG